MRICRLALLVGLVAFASGQPVLALEKPEDIRACARKNYPATSSRQSFSLTSFGRDNSDRTLRATAFWKRSSDDRVKVMLMVEGPEDLRGSSYLMLEKASRDDLFMYLPAVQRVKRIQGSQTSDKLWGTDFSYEDIKQVQGILDAGALTRQADTELDGKKVYVLNFVPDKAEESVYQRVVSYIDQATCVALKTELFEKGDTPRKRLTVDPLRVKQEGQRWVAYFYEMRDLREETRTELVLEKMSADVDLPERLFNQQTFYLGK